MEIVTFILLIIFLTGLVFMFRLVNNLYDRIETQQQIINDTYNNLKVVCNNIDMLRVSVKNLANIVNTVYDNTVEIPDMNKVVNNTCDTIKTVDDRVGMVSSQIEAKFSLIESTLHSCKYKTKKSLTNS